MSVLNEKSALSMIRRSIRRVGIVVTGCVLLTFLVNNPLFGQEPYASEAQIKAVYLYNFTQFVQWPDEAFAEKNAPLVIGVLGYDPFGHYLDETVKGEVINSHPLTIQRYERAEDVKGCHILFIGGKNKDEIRSALDYLGNKSVLTVSDVDGFTRLGGMVNFFNDKGRIRLRINVVSATAADLVISSKLLRLADIHAQKNN